MTKLLKRHGVGLIWSFVVFTAALLFYLVSAAFVPYLGLSSEYLTALCYPAHASSLLNSPTDVVFFRTLLQFIPSQSLCTAIGFVQCLIGAAIVTCLFRSAIATVRHSCLDLTGIRQNELDRTLFSISHASLATGLGTALLATTLLPLWATATRPYPQSLAALIAVATLTAALEFRWHAAQQLILAETAKLRHAFWLLLTTAGIAYLSLTHAMLLPVAAFALVLAGGIFLKREAQGRFIYAMMGGAGVILGLIASVLVTGTWASMLNVTHAPLPNTLVIWAQQLAATLPATIRSFTAFEGLVPLVLFLTAAALFLGTFPFAYLKLGAPIIGQLACIALGVVLLLQWPAAAWELLEEPNALCIVGGCMAILCLGALFGSWLHHLLEHTHRWNRRKVRLVALSITFIILGSYAITQGCINALTGSGRPMTQAMETIAPVLDQLLPEETQLWITPNPDTFGMLARRVIAQKPVYPQTEDFATVTEASLAQHPVLGQLAKTDSLLRRLAKLGGEPLRQYLLTEKNTLGILTHLDAQTTAVEAARAARLLSDTPVGSTTIGKRCVTQLNRLAAREHAACAIRTEPEIAVTHLRLARTLDPENPGIKLSLAALKEQMIAITQEELDAARDVLEAEPRWKAPSEHDALTFEYRYGPVQTQGFCSASRLRRLRLGNAPAVLEEILHLYRHVPKLLSKSEHLIAMLNLPEAEAAIAAEKSDPECAEMELFFCLYPDNPISTELYQRHAASLRGRDALTVLFRNRVSHLRDRTSDKMLAFFSRDGVFAYALYYVNALLAADQMETAIAFAGGFNVRERLAKTPALIEELCCRVLDKLEESAPAHARVVCQGWLRSNPRQHRLWTHLLNNPSSSAEQNRIDIETCLLYYPLHPIATHLYAALLEEELGPEAAARYRNAIQQATATGSCIQKDGHAHSRL